MPLLPLEATLLKTLPRFQGLQEGEVSISLLINVSSIRAWEQFFATKRPGARTPVNAQPNANLFNPKNPRQTMLDLCFHHDIIQPSSNVSPLAQNTNVWLLHLSNQRLLAMMFLFSFLSSPFKPPLRSKFHLEASHGSPAWASM